MDTTQTEHAEQNRLRFVFADAIVSLNLLGEPTLWDIARRLARLPKRRYGAPIAIDVTLDRPRLTAK